MFQLGLVRLQLQLEAVRGELRWGIDAFSVVSTACKGQNNGRIVAPLSLCRGEWERHEYCDSSGVGRP